ncbi:hypothetical protein CYY_010461, partial [Polysphondylium violaceum]
MVPSYPLDADYCINTAYYLIDLNGRTDIYSITGTTKFKNATHILQSAFELVNIGIMNHQHSLTFYLDPNFQTSFQLTNIATSNCEAVPYPLKIDLKHIPQTYNEVPMLNSLTYKPNLSPNIKIGAMDFKTKSGPFTTGSNILSNGYFQVSFSYDPLSNSSSTDQTITFSSLGNVTDVTLSSFLNQYYPPGNIGSVNFYPSCGADKKKSDTNIVLIETTGNPIYGSVSYGPYETFPIFPVSKVNGKSQYLSVHQNGAFSTSAVNITLGVYNKESPITSQCAWAPKPDSLPSFLSTNSSFYVVDQEKGLSLMNFIIKGAANIAFDDAIWFPQNSSYFGDFMGYGTEQNYTYTRSDYVLFQGPISGIRTILSGANFPTINFPTVFTDTQPPRLKNLEFEFLSSGWMLIRAHITDDISGFNKLTLSTNGAIITQRNLVSGTIYDGIYELRTQIFLTASSTIIFLLDRVGNLENINDFYLSNPFYSLEKQVPNLPAPVVELADITTFRFEPNNINVTTFGSLCTMYLGYKGAKPEFPPAIYMRLSKSFDINSETDMDRIPLMQWDSTLGLYKYQFFVPPRLFSGNIDYLLSLSSYLL